MNHRHWSCLVFLCCLASTALAQTAPPNTCSSSCLPRSCKEILDSGRSTGSGVYTIDIDGAAPLAPIPVYCDMVTAGGGWTLILNQVPSQILPDSQDTAFPENLGSLTASYRLGSSYMRILRPILGWAMTDNTHRVYFKPTCFIDWANALNEQPIGECNRGYTGLDFTTPFSSVITTNFSRGLGQNNGGASCCIRGYHDRYDAGLPAGAALSCNPWDYSSNVVRLWFK